MDMRIDAARNNDLTTGVDNPRRADRLQAARSTDRGDLAAGDTDIGGLRAGGQNGGAAGDDQIEHCALRYRVRLYS